MGSDPGLGSGVLMLEWWSPDEEGVVLPGSVADACKEAGSGRGFYSGCYRLFVPGDLTAFMTHHAAAPLTVPAILMVRRALAGGGVPTLPVPGRLYDDWRRPDDQLRRVWPRRWPSCPRV
ncbi:hypothetical protein B296_00034554 [Ensete ventricosum]|uniref:Uncharacterized protein n=1 Tax=Ensete ventricosum TaxID=4639 RepID=A0A426XGB1_ENSVE|nr:hypothetical protein B296_00034554 [Ensete ventricosum]